MQNCNQNLHIAPFAPLYTSMEQLADDYDGFLVDVWGVIHEGCDVFPGVIDCLIYLKERNKTVIFATNSPRGSQDVIDHLAEKGVSRTFYTDLISSGALFQDDLFSTDCVLSVNGRIPRIYFIDEYPNIANLHGCLYSSLESMIPDGKLSEYFDSFYDVVTDIEETDFLVVLTINKDEVNVSKYASLLKQAIDLNVPMICVNSDVYAYRGDERFLRPGFLAEQYRNMGGSVMFYGKPLPRIFEHGLSLMPNIDPSKVLMIGDTIMTDVKGAIGIGLKSALIIPNTQHGQDVLASINQDEMACCRPDYFLNGFKR